MLGSRDRDARVTTQYLDALLSASGERAADVPADTALEAPVRLAARRLRADLIRFHPSFRFQEALAARLAVEAERMRLGLPLPAAAPAGAVSGAIVLPFPFAPADAIDIAAAGDLEPSEYPYASPRITRDTRPLIVGGVASAAISIGAAYVAWRWTRPSNGAMTRAVRAAHAATARAGIVAATVASAAAGTAAASAAAAAGATVNAAATTTSVLTAAAISAPEPRASARRAARERGRSVLQGLLGVVA